MKKGAIVVFVKTPGLTPLKTRLAEDTGVDYAHQFYRLASSSVAEAIVETQRSVRGVEIEGVWAVAEEKGLKSPIWSRFPAIYQGKGELGKRLSHVYQELSQNYDFCIFLGADCPQVDPAVLEKAVHFLKAGKTFVLGMAEDGGFYLFGGNIEVSESIWTSIPYSDWRTGQVLLDKLSKLGPVQTVQQSFDIDTKEDIPRLTKLLKSRVSLLPAQKKLLEWLETRPAG